jgi:hypothetical protein
MARRRDPTQSHPALATSVFSIFGNGKALFTSR